MNTSMNGSQKAERVPDTVNSESEKPKAWVPPIMVRLDVSAAGTSPRGTGNDSVYNYS
jgi:hypothetical protein